MIQVLEILNFGSELESRATSRLPMLYDSGKWNDLNYVYGENKNNPRKLGSKQ